MFGVNGSACQSAKPKYGPETRAFIPGAETRQVQDVSWGFEAWRLRWGALLASLVSRQLPDVRAERPGRSRTERDRLLRSCAGGAGEVAGQEPDDRVAGAQGCGRVQLCQAVSWSGLFVHDGEPGNDPLCAPSRAPPRRAACAGLPGSAGSCRAEALADSRPVRSDGGRNARGACLGRACDRRRPQR